MTNTEKIIQIKNYVEEVLNDENAMVIEQEIAQDVLNIINGLKPYTRGEELLHIPKNAQVADKKFIQLDTKQTLNYTGIVNRKVWIMVDLKNTDLYDLFSDEIAEPEILDSIPITTEKMTKKELKELELLKNTIRLELKTANVVQVIPRN